MLGNQAAYVIILNLFITLASKPAGIYVLSSAFSFQYFVIQLNLLYKHPWPFLISDKIIALKCELSYGNPSNLVASQTFLWMTIYLHAYYDVGVKAKKMSVFCTAYIIKMAVNSIGLIYLVLLMTSQVYEGVNTWN